jgi:RimJ/RimL family protein N-acetyltransferase
VTAPDPAQNIVPPIDHVIATLAKDPLRNIVLLKHLEAFPDHTCVHHLANGSRTATLVLLDTAPSAYDRAAYPAADYAALIASDDAALTLRLLDMIPGNAGIVFKVAGEEHGSAIARQFMVERTAEFWSFTSAAPFEDDREVRLTQTPPDAAFDLFEAQGHARSWLEPLLRRDRAVACVIGPERQPHAVCFAFGNYERVWEIGGVVAPSEYRGRGYASRVVRTALAELARRRLTPRYQVDRDNMPSIRLAESVGLRRFLTITHFLHLPLADKSAARAE